MSKKLFTNLPVKSLEESIIFFTKLGFTFNPQFTDKNGTCMIVGEDSFIMLLTEEFFRKFTKKDLVNAANETEVINAISVDSKEEVDKMVNAALANGGRPSNDLSDEGGMYAWSFQDLDDHLWEVLYMDPSTINS